MTWKLLYGLTGLLAIVLGAILLATTGFVPIAASSEHWAVTRWFLEYGMSRSVSTWSAGVEPPPPLDDPALVLKGAGHYETACAFCHGSPGQRLPVVPHHMTPHPPDLAEAVPQWEEKELFWIVRHGVKFTGMPAWPTQERPDEVWAMVAFLQRLPDLEERAYRELVFPEPGPLAEEAPDVVVERCARCHGVDGLGRGEGAFPRLAGQSEAYLHASLEAFARAERHSGVMQPIAVALRGEQLREAARWFAGLPDPAPVEVDPALAARGETIALEGIPDRKIPACAACHGPKEGPRSPHYPELGGQYPAYLQQQLELWVDERRGGTPYAEVMRTVASHALEKGEMEEVAAFYGGVDGRLTGRAGLR